MDVLLADDQAMVRQGLAALIQREEQLNVVGQASDGHEAIRLTSEVHPDVAILDLGMPLLNGLDASREINRISPKTKTILLAMHGEDHHVIEALRAGVRGYVLKRQLISHLIQAIRDVWSGSVYLSPEVSSALVKKFSQ